MDALTGASQPPTRANPTLPFLGLFQPQSPPQFPVNAFANACYVRDRDTITIYQEKSKKSQHKMAVAAIRPVAAPTARRSRPFFRWGPPQTVRVTCGGKIGGVMDFWDQWCRDISARSTVDLRMSLLCRGSKDAPTLPTMLM